MAWFEVPLPAGRHLCQSSPHPCSDKIDEGANARCKMFMAGINGVDHLHLLGIIILQHRHEQTGLDVRFDVKFSDPSEPEACQA